MNFEEHKKIVEAIDLLFFENRGEAVATLVSLVKTYDAERRIDNELIVKAKK